MKRLIFTLLALPAIFAQMPITASESGEPGILAGAKQASVFKGRFYNKEYSIYIDMDLYHQNRLIQGQEFLGEVPGYLGDNKDARKWIFTDASIKDSLTANLSITNDYGSEDLEATLTYNPKDSTYVLKQGEGSTIKIARNRKWVKLPGSIVFK